MKTTQLKCPACGSTELEKLQWNEYRCAHCNSTLKLDSEGKRLELTGWVCPQCSFNNPVGQRFCSKCGAKLVRACPRCKAENPLDAQFCGSCGFDYVLRAEWKHLQWELGRLQSELDKLMEEQTLLKAKKGRSARWSLERVSSRSTQLRLEISELEKTGATPASLRKWAKKKREEERPQPATSRGIMQWFKRQDALVKTFIMGFGFVALLFLCFIGFAVITPTPQTDSTSKYAREYETTAAQRDATRAASAPTSVTTPTEKPTRTQRPPAPTTSVPAATTLEASTPEPTPTGTQKPTSTQKPTTTPTPEHTPTPIVYVIKAGDTLSAIAKEFGVTVEALQEANAILDLNQIQVGQELIIPQGKTITTATATRARAMLTPVSPTATPLPIMYFCGYDLCRNSGLYGELVFPTGINVWNNPDPDRGGVHHRASHGDKVIIIEERRVHDASGGLWYRLQGGGWTNDLWLTDAICTPENLVQYTLDDC